MTYLFFCLFIIIIIFGFHKSLVSKSLTIFASLATLMLDQTDELVFMKEGTHLA